MDIKEKILAAAIKNLRAQITEKVGAIRDPDTGEFPTVVVRGDSLDNLKIHVEGSPKLVNLVRERLGMGTEDASGRPAPSEPHAFLSYTSDNADLAKRIAEALQASGIETWWAEWCIGPGDSLRQKIDEGIGGCTHFLVLLTPQSIDKPWVNQEMDAGLVRKLNDQCKFLPLRFDLPASRLPPLLSGMHSPTIQTDEDIAQLVSDIYGVSRKPPRGPAPETLKTSVDAQTGYSPAATAIAHLFVERTNHAMFSDPQFRVAKIAEETGLSVEDTKDALFELSAFFKVSHDHVFPHGSLFVEFDRHWKPWKPAEDALKLAADIVNDPGFPADCKAIADRYGWDPRRLNPAVHYLLERGLVVDYRAIATQPWAIVKIVGKAEEIRRFVRSRA